MARPIKETPVLKGKDARRFESNVRNNKQEAAKVSPDKYKRAMRIYKSIIVSG
jgi:hypothetical protein